MPITVYPTTEANLTVPIRRKIKGSHSEGTDGLKTAFATVTYQVDWADRWEFVRQINGIFPAGPQRLPMQYPDLPGILVSGTNNMRGLGIGTGCLNPYKYALVDVTFRTPQYESSGDNAYLKLDRDIGGQFVTCPSGVYQFPDDVKSDVGIAEFVPLIVYSITRLRIHSFDDSVFQPYVSKLNDSTLFGCEAGTLRFDGVQSTSTVDIGGVVLTDATFGFTWRKIDWNFAKHPKTGEWALLDPVIYESTSLGDLFS